MRGMTNIPSTTDRRDIRPADARRRAMQLLFAGAAAAVTVALFGAAQPSDSPAPLASAPAQGITVIPVNDDNPGGVNDQGQTSGDIFQQNAQDQSTADGAGTS